MVIDQLPVARVTQETLAATRAAVAQAVELLRAATPEFPDIEVSQHWVHGPGAHPTATSAAPTAAPAVRVLLYRPRAHAAALPALLWIHGGG